MTRVGFIGLGVMGTPMAGHLARAGHALALHDLNAEAAASLAASLAAAGHAARAAEGPAAVGAVSDIVVTMLPHGGVVRDVALGTAGRPGLIESLAPGSLLLDCSSAEPWHTRETAAALAARGIAMVDAPVSGAAWGARDAQLVFMVGGTPADVARVRPLLDRLGRAVHHLGPLGSGHAMKCLNNEVTAVTLAATAEALVAGVRAGLDPAAMVEVMNQSTSGSWITQTQFHQRIFNRAFDDPFKLELMLKDIGIAMQLASESGTPMPLAALNQQLWRAADHAMGPGVSLSEFVRFVERQTGTELRAAAPDLKGPTT